MNMFEKAARAKTRFETSQGMLSVEELWDLPLTSKTGKASLDGIARELYNKLKVNLNVSFVEPERTDTETQFQFDLVKHIIDVRLAENQAAILRRENAEKKQRVLSLIAQKEDNQLSEMSLEDLRRLVEAL